MELHSDAQLLKTMLNVRYCYLRLMEEIEVNNDGVNHGLLSFSYKLNVKKDVANIVSNIYALVDETNMVFDGESWSCFTLIWCRCYYHFGVPCCMCSCGQIIWYIFQIWSLLSWTYVLAWLAVVLVKLVFWILKLVVLCVVLSIPFTNYGRRGGGQWSCGTRCSNMMFCVCIDLISWCVATTLLMYYFCWCLLYLF